MMKGTVALANVGPAMGAALPLESAGVGFLAAVGRQLERIESGAQDRTTTCVASAEGEDRALDWIDQRSWLLDEWRSNPVILNNHAHMQVVGVGRSAEVKRHNGKDALLIDVEWDLDSPVDDVRNVGHQHLRGIRRAFSVGFRPGRRTARNKLPKSHAAYREPIEVETWFGTIEVAGTLFEGNTLLELSSATVPMHPGALQLAQLEWARAAAVDPARVPPPPPSLRSGPELLELAAHGDESALQRLIERLWPAVLNKARTDLPFRRIVAALAIPAGPPSSSKGSKPFAALVHDAMQAAGERVPNRSVPR